MEEEPEGDKKDDAEEDNRPSLLSNLPSPSNLPSLLNSPSSSSSNLYAVELANCKLLTGSDRLEGRLEIVVELNVDGLEG